MNGIEDALRRCGVTDESLALGEKDALDRRGYIVLTDVVGPDWLARLREEFELAFRRGSSIVAGKESGTRHVAALERGDAIVDGVYTHPRVLAAVHHVLRRAFRVFQLSGRDPLPGFGLQGLHTDWLPRAAPQRFDIVTVLWLLDDFTQTNGATRLIPGSHLATRPLPKSMQAPASRHPDQVIVVAKAGSVVVLNGHVWHSGTRNDTHGPRRVLQCQFVARDASRPADVANVALDRWSPAARYLLGM